MKIQFMKFTLAASIGLALAFTFSCSDGGEDGDSSSSVLSSSSSEGTEISSSSDGGSSSSFSSSSSEIAEVSSSSDGDSPSSSSEIAEISSSSDGGSSSSFSSSSSEIAEVSSSSDGGSPSSSSGPCTAADNTETQYCSNGTMKEYGFVEDAGGNTYKTVEIGEQVWTAENLNYVVEGSTCYSNQESYCDTYGRLYDWATAMALPLTCNSNYCGSANQGQDIINSPHQGICPNGWHIPTVDEWEALFKYVNEKDYCYTCESKYLKAVSGWNDYFNESGNGEDTYGFRALPGGAGYKNDFEEVGDHGCWWSADENDGSFANRRNMSGAKYLESGASGKETWLYSVRCVKD